MSVRVIVISGSMGSGKTTVLGEASDILSARGVIHAAIDLDAIGSALLPDALSSDVMYRNLASVWVNFAAVGVNRLLLAEAVENRDERATGRSAGVAGAASSILNVVQKLPPPERMGTP